eukprot:144269-Pyramimonas_sp.AAC.1
MKRDISTFTCKGMVSGTPSSHLMCVCSRGVRLWGHDRPGAACPTTVGCGRRNRYHLHSKQRKH